VLKQDYADIEVLIVDDNGKGSEFDTETENVVNSLKIDFKKRNIRYLKHQVNANGASARNTGILASTGEYICFLDDDDIYLPGRITKSIDSLKNCQDHIGGLYCGFLGWNSQELNPDRFAVGDLTQEILMLDYEKHYLHTNTATYRRKPIFDINGFDPSYHRHQDLEFNIRYFEKHKIGALKYCLVHLAPEKSSVDNKIYGIEMLLLKEKFLAQFADVIKRFDDVSRKEVFKKHWAEVVRYVKNEAEIKSEIETRFDNGPLQIKQIIG